jgi:alkylhydroperoxidase family enzyme
MPRLPDPDLTNPSVAPLAEELGKARGGKLLNVDRALLHNPDLARASRELFRVIRTQFKISDRLRELVSCRVAVLNRAPYEYNQHEALALKAGFLPSQMESLKNPEPTGFDAVETIVIRLTDAMTQRVQVPDELFNEVRKHFSDQLVVELVATIASYNYMSRFLEAMQVEIE